MVRVISIESEDSEWESFDGIDLKY